MNQQIEVLLAFLSYYHKVSTIEDGYIWHNCATQNTFKQLICLDKN